MGDDDPIDPIESITSDPKLETFEALADHFMAMGTRCADAAGDTREIEAHHDGEAAAWEAAADLLMPMMEAGDEGLQIRDTMKRFVAWADGEAPLYNGGKVERPKAREQLVTLYGHLEDVSSAFAANNALGHAYPDDDPERPQSLDRQGVRATYGARLADRITEWLDTLDSSDADMIITALHRDITDREEA